ncbi:hypothetical protein [Pseudoxanthomonas japonensis]|uniref:Uncharacterized protein n=1 Tax=Pseudoxanthomonas japonensis TaxID=69284 RepID=A0ABQ6ZJA1_9GAMM|nr:hypothetical protein [Pseudoxanthomonas japonensis]KAF1726147.1 hypothetical protein CSC78_05640 [Pseudoxanthomonas japonensis]
MKRRLTGYVVMALCAMPVIASAAKPAPKTLARGELPAGFAIGDASPSLALQVEVVDGKVVASAPAGDAPGNLRAARSGDATQTTLMVSSTLAEAVKFDLYVSTDGEQFTYTSSCGVTPGISSFEMWEKPVTHFAIGNPRVLPKGRMACD